jgi:hypothetical protein
MIVMSVLAGAGIAALGLINVTRRGST